MTQSGLLPGEPSRLPAPYEFTPAGIRVEGLLLSDLAERFGTPLYVTSGTRIRENVHRLRSALIRRWPSSQLLYAIKANSNPAILRILQELGCGADCSSPAEIALARSAGFPRPRTLYTAAYPTDPELAGAIAAGVAVNLDHPGLLPRLLEFGRPPVLSFRLNPGQSAAGPEGLRFAGRDSKFGSSLADVRRGLESARRAGVPDWGIHTMPGSNILAADHFGRVGAFLGRAVRGLERVMGRPPIFVDAGGGLGVPYRPTERELDLEAAVSGLVLGLRSAPSPDSFQLWMEPGRYLVADSTVLLARVSDMKPGRPAFVGTDAGMQTLLRPALYGAYHAIYPAGPARPGTRRRVTVTGPICENTDLLGRDRRLPPLEIGDLLAVATVGAYGYSMSSPYNNRPRPAEVLVEDGRARLIRERETVDDLLRLVPESERNGRERR